jgi:Type ISP C-terminal specificity domain
MTLQQYQENTFDIQHIVTARFSFEMNELKNFCAALKNPPKLNSEVVNKISTRLSLTYTLEKEIPEEGAVCFANSPEVRPEFRLTFTSADIFDYIYAVFHSRFYRDKYKEFLKKDSPRVPYPKDSTSFWQLVKLGGELKLAHLSALTKVERIMKEIDKVPVE